MKLHDRIENWLILTTSVVIGIFGFLAAFGFVFLRFSGFHKGVILNVIIVIFATVYSFIVGNCFSKLIIKWLKIKSHCYFRAFWYGVLGSLATIILTVGSIGTIVGMTIATTRVISGTEHIPIFNIILQSFASVILGSLFVLIATLSEPLIWTVFLISGVFGIIALLIFQKKLKIK